jgi:hypothetical protein
MGKKVQPSGALPHTRVAGILSGYRQTAESKSIICFST